MAKEQLKREVAVKNQLVILDTDLTVFAIWIKEKYHLEIDWINQQLSQSTNKIYFLCDTTIEWEEDALREHPKEEDRKRLFELTDRFRREMLAAGFTLNGSDHPIVPVMLGDAKLAQKMSEKLLDRGVYAIGFFFPVVPVGTARIRTQMNAALTQDELDRALAAFETAGKDLGVIS